MLKRLVAVIVMFCALCTGNVFAISSIDNGTWTISGRGAYLNNGVAVLEKNTSISFPIDVSDNSLYSIRIWGEFTANSIYNISINKEMRDNVYVSGNDMDYILFFADLTTEDSLMTMFVGAGRAEITKTEVSPILYDDAKNFISKINQANKAEEVKSVVNSYISALNLNTDAIESEIFYSLPAYAKLLGKDYEHINRIAEDLLSALYEEKENPAVEISQAGERLTSLKQGIIDFSVRKDSSGYTTFAAVYNNSGRLFSINEFVENGDESFSFQIDLSKETDACKYTFKLLTVDSLTDICPFDKYDGIEKEIYVSNNGSDTYNGDINSPFKTISRVKEEIRKLNQNMQGDIIVNISSGEYAINSEEIFTEAESGKNGYRVIIRGDKENKPVFTGGKAITGWTSYKNGIYKATFDSEEELRELYVDDVPAIRAKSKWIYEYLTDYDDGNVNTKKIIVSDDNFPSISNAESAELVWKRVWVCQRTPVHSIEIIDSKTVVTLANFYQTSKVDSLMVKAGQTFFVENALEVLDEPGEFYFDVNNKTIYYYPEEGKNIDSLNIVAPTTEGLIRVKGQSVSKRAENISFENIVFEYGTWHQPNNYPLLATQAGAATNAETKKTQMLPPAQINVDYANNISFSGCVFQSLGTTAIAFSDGVSNVSFSGNVMKDIGGAAITVGTSLHSDTKVSDDAVVCKNIEISNNVVRRTAISYKQMPSLTVYYGNGIKITNNDIKDTAYTGISIGWGWGSAANISANSGRFLVSENRVSGVLHSLLDGANIYTLGQLPDSVIKDNYFSYNLAPKNFKYPGIYLDEGSQYIGVHDNVVMNCGERWLFINSVVEDMECFIGDNFTDSTSYKSKSETEISENTMGMTEMTKEASDIADKAGVKPEYVTLLNGVMLSDVATQKLYATPKNPYFDGIYINAVEYTQGQAYELGEKYMCFNYKNWMDYDLEVPESGTYILKAYVALGGTNENSYVDFVWSFANSTDSGTGRATYTGSYGDYEAFTLGTVELSAGLEQMFIKHGNTTACHLKKFTLEKISD